MTASPDLNGHSLDDEASRAGGARGPLRKIWDRSKRALATGSITPWIVGGLWFAGSLVLLLWMWGLDPLVFPSPDEAVVRYAAQLVRDHGSPIMKVPFPDPEDMAHPRSWVTLGDYFVPTYAPVSLYLFGYVLRLRSFGLLLLAVLPTSALGAFAAGVAYLMPPLRRWLAVLAPALAFPAFYWLLRPWVNISPLLACLCWAFFFWARWRLTDKRLPLAASALLVGLGSAIRPDYAAFLLLAALLVSLAAAPRQWRWSFVFFSLAGVCALGSNLFLNKLLTGHPLQAAYQVALDRQWGPQDGGGGGNKLLGILRVLMVPMGWPIPKIALHTFAKYWLQMGPIAVLLVAQLAIIPLLWRSWWLPRALYGAAFCVFAFFVYSRLHDDVFGGHVRFAWAEHSVPRYLTPAYLFAAVSPLLLVARFGRRLLAVSALLLLGVAGVGVWEVWAHQPSSFLYVRRYVPQNEEFLEKLKGRVPDTAMIYCVSMDKVIWSNWRLGTIEDQELSASSMARAVAAKQSVYMLDSKYETASHRRLGILLAKRGLVFVQLDRRYGLYRLQPGGSPRH